MTRKQIEALFQIEDRVRYRRYQFEHPQTWMPDLYFASMEILQMVIDFKQEFKPGKKLFDFAGKRQVKYLDALCKAMATGGELPNIDGAL